MHDDTLHQARELYRTVALLKQRMACQFADSLKSEPDGMICADMTFPQSNAMMVIQERGGVTVKELAEQLHVSPPSASAMVDRLVDMGMLDREQSREDRREVRIRVSEKGGESIEAVESQILATITGLLEKLGPDMSRQWVEVYGHVREILESERGGRHRAGAGKERV